MPSFSFIGQHIALDFANTIEWRGSGSPVERLTTYSDLANWARQAALVSPEQATYLIQAQTVRLSEAQSALEAARSLREGTYRLVLAAARGPALPADVETLNRFLREGLFRLRLRASASRYDLSWAADDVLNYPLWPIAWAAAQLLTSPKLARVKQCASEDGCGWLFLDRSKNLSRRWCDMRSCGNAAKTRRFRERLAPRE